MYKLGNKSTEIFCQLRDATGVNLIHSFDLPSIGIHIEKLDGNSIGTQDCLQLIEIETRPKILNSGIQACLMRFLLWDRRFTSSDYLMAEIYPQALQRDPKMPIEIAVFIQDRIAKHYNPQLQKAQVAFADIWLPHLISVIGPPKIPILEIAIKDHAKTDLKLKSDTLRPQRLSA